MFIDRMVKENEGSLTCLGSDYFALEIVKEKADENFNDNVESTEDDEDDNDNEEEDN